LDEFFIAVGKEVFMNRKVIIFGKAG